MAYADPGMSTATAGRKNAGAASVIGPRDAFPGREPFHQFIKRAALAIAFDMKPPRHRAAPVLYFRLLGHLLSTESSRRRLPDASSALAGREGVAGFCDDMSLATLRAAYAQGLYPCTHMGPVRWNAPPRRAVLDIAEFHLRDELKRKLKKDVFRVTFDELGSAHSVEVWDAQGRLAGGLFGTVVGPCFVVESLFHTQANTSKYGLAVLIAHLQAWGFRYVDNKLQNPHTHALGFREIDRDTYIGLISAARPEGANARWQVDERLDLGRWRPAQGPHPARCRDLALAASVARAGLTDAPGRACHVGRAPWRRRRSGTRCRR